MKSNVCRPERNRGYRIIIITMIVCAMSFLFISMRGTQSHVDAHSSVETYYKSIQINEGDSLWQIAEEYGDSEIVDRDEYMKEIKSINHLSDNDAIHSGQYLTVPYYVR